MGFIEAFLCLKHIVRTTLGNKCVFLPFFPSGYACECENVTHSLNRCHASAVRRIYLIFFLITVVLAKKHWSNVLFIRKWNVHGLFPPQWLAPCHCILGYHRTSYFCSKINKYFDDNKRSQTSFCAHMGPATENNDNYLLAPLSPYTTPDNEIKCTLQKLVRGCEWGAVSQVWVQSDIHARPCRELEMFEAKHPFMVPRIPH